MNDLIKNGISNYNISHKLIMGIIEQYIDDYGIQQFVRNVELNKALYNSNLGQYNSNNGLILINVPYYQKKLNLIKTNKLLSDKNKTGQCEDTYAYLIHTIYHELTHAKQRHDWKENKLSTDIYTIFYDCYRSPNGIYELCHDLFPTEYNADVEGYLEAIRNKLGTERMLKLYKGKLYQSTYMKYKVKKGTLVSPVEHFYQTLNIKTPVIESHDYSKRLVYGLPITVEEYTSKIL